MEDTSKHNSNLMPAQKKSGISVITMTLVLLVVFGILSFLNIFYFASIKDYYIRRKANLTYEKFIKLLQAGDANAAYDITSEEFRDTINNYSKNDPQEVPKDNKKSPGSLSALTTSNTFQDIIKNNFELYRSNKKPTKEGSSVITARFINNRGNVFDMTAQLSSNNGQWQLDYIDLPAQDGGGILQ